MISNRVSIILLIVAFSIKGNGQSCAGFPAFAKELGFEPLKSALSSSERRQIGLQLIEFDSLQNLGLNRKTKRNYVHPSWTQAGYLGSITRDEYGNAYVSPLPAVNMNYNKQKDLNTIFKIDSKTGAMQPWAFLPLPDQVSNENCFGIMGLHYDCFTNQLLVSTVAGSNRKEESGKIYVVNVQTKEAKEILSNVDALGMAVFRNNNRIYLCFGSSRESYLFSVQLDKNLNPISSPQLFLSLEGLGPRGDDKIKKINVNDGKLELHGTPFYYNLSSPPFFQETVYTFSSDANGRWHLNKVF